MKKAFLFPGQGSQFVGMGKDLYDNFNEVKDVYESVNDTLKLKLTDIIFQGDESLLKITSNAQPSLMLTSMAVLKTLEILSKKNVKDLCSVLAGHSLGEYTALCAAETLTLNDTALILKARGNSMEKSLPSNEGAMYALIGSTNTDAKRVCSILSQNGTCEIANDNGGSQIIISGSKKSFSNIDSVIKSIGIKKAILLKVDTAFHCSLMRKSTLIMQEELKKYKFYLPKIDVIANYSANTYSSVSNIKNLLVKQIEGKVRWRETIAKMYHQKGIRKFVELGPGRVLTNIIKRDYQDVVTYNLESLLDIQNYLKLEM